MSNRDDFDFDDDLFGDDDFGEDEEVESESFEFGDDDEFEDFDDIDSFDEVDDEFLLDEDDDGGGGGANRTFIVLAGFMIILFIAGLVLVFFLATREVGPSPTDLTITQIVQLNMTAERHLEQTQTQAALNVIATETQAVVDLQATQTAEVFQVTETAAAVIALTQAAELELAQTAAVLTQAAEDEIRALTEAALPVDETPDAPPPVTPEPQTQVGIGDVAMTATAIAERLQTPIVQVTPSPPVGGPVVGPPPALPDTGLFDDITGGQSMGVIMLLAFGLIGVIFGARRLRSMNSDNDNKE